MLAGDWQCGSLGVIWLAELWRPITSIACVSFTMKLSFFVWENLTGRSSSSLYWRNFKVSTLDYDNKWTLRFRKQWTIAGGRFRGNDVSFKEFLSEIGTLLSGGFYSKIGLRLSTRLVYNVMVNNVSLCSFGYAFDDV